MGHALNASIQDLLIRLNRMQGRRTKWIFGTDHAGIATQIQVEKQLEREGTSRAELGREAFTERVWQWREQYGGTIVEQFRRLGASLDYADERFTMDEQYVRAVLRVFVALYEKGYVYRDSYMVNWDPGLRSAISDLEVEQRTRRGHALQDRLPARGRLRLDHDRDGAAGDDPRRHRDRGASGRRALHAPDRRARDPAARRPPAADHRRRVRRPRVRHGRAEDHAGPRPERLRDRPRARARRDHGDRRGRAHDGGGGRVRGPARRRGAQRRGRRAARRRASSRARSRSSTTCRTRTARASGSSR